MDSIKEFRVRAANSFTRSEVNWMNQLFATMARGGDVSAFRKTKEYKALYQKVLRMKQRLDAPDSPVALPDE